MTEVTRVFDVENRRFLNVQRKYSGQQYDSLSTTLHFEYDPTDFLVTKHDGEKYYPYIWFNVLDDTGCPMVYGPLSTPKFNGYTFSIPWDVTSRIKSQRIEYQLYFVSDNYYVYDEAQRKYVESGNGTKYLLSPIDGIAIKPSISAKKKCGCPPLMAPTTEPSVVGYINMWREKGLIGPVETSFDPDTGLYTLHFQTFSGETYDVELSVDTSGVGALSEDLEATMTVGGIPKGQIFRKGTRYEDIFRMLLHAETPVEALIARYGAVTSVPPYNHNGFTTDPNTTWDIMTSEDGWDVVITTGTVVGGERVKQHAAVSVNKSLKLVSWYAKAAPMFDYVQLGQVREAFPGSEPTPTPTPGVTETYTIRKVDADHTISAIFSPASSSVKTYTIDTMNTDHTITAEFTEQSGGEDTDADYHMYYLTIPTYDRDKGGIEYILKFEVI